MYKTFILIVQNPTKLKTITEAYFQIKTKKHYNITYL